MPERLIIAPSSYPRVLTVDQLAKLLQLPRSTTYEAISRGEIPGVRKVGRHIRVCRDSVLDWLSGDSRVPRSTQRRSA